MGATPIKGFFFYTFINEFLFPCFMDDHGVEYLGKHLENKKIALLISSGIAAYKTPSLIRHLRQYGADVHAYVTPEATRFVKVFRVFIRNGLP